ncbi:MAG: N-acetylornithine carbamoyltransferase [Gammaproteobacteria bacterium]|nr:N-acetylornithine carbamoyltransferase [Gammaproteobacteria bacterium]MBT8445402.1 N-acetylornithine carbamoyltransferase [Gammaproteobacteria bacterium]NND37755.1 N-acetylornithine carbamoyltransferase [Gammaproteobacteria bacterium]
MKEFHDLADLNAAEIEELLQLARRLQENPEPRALEGKVLALLFMSPSLRTLASFQAAMTRLGGGSFVISPDMSIHGIETRPGIVMDGQAAEHVREAVPVIASYADAIGIRAFAERHNLANDLADKEFNEMRELCNIPLINMESAINHPCQSLADWKTMDEIGVPRKGGKFVLSWAYHPRMLPLAVPAATVHMAAARGMDVTVVRPEGFELPDEIMQKAEAAANASGGSLTETDDRAAALEDAHIIYAKSWSSTRHYADRLADEELRADLDDWCVDNSWFDTARDDCRFMHCLPVRRGVVVTDEVLDGPRSIVIQEAQNRMFAQMAVLHKIMLG